MRVKIQKILSFGIGDPSEVVVNADRAWQCGWRAVDRQEHPGERGFAYFPNLDESIWLGATWIEARANAQRIAEKPLIFAVKIQGFPDGGYIRLESGPEISHVSVADLCAAHPRLVVVDGNHIAHGGGLHIQHQGESTWLPAAVVRGHPPATAEELASAPEWAHSAYHWYFGGQEEK